MKCTPIIPVWLMIVICVALLILRWRSNNKKVFARQIIIVGLLFVMNLRMMIPTEEAVMHSGNRNLYVLFVVDDTISMMANDGEGYSTRLENMQSDCKQIMQKLYGSKYSLIVFHNSSQVKMPYVDNVEYAETLIDGIYPLEALWAKGTTLNVCLDDLEYMTKNAHDKEDGDVVVFFMSDGEIISGDPLSSFKKAAPYIDYGAVVGYGTTTGGEMYVLNEDGEGEYLQTHEYPYENAISRIDEDNLKQIASDLGLAYVHRTSASSIDSVLHEIEDASQLEIHERFGKGYRESYYYFAIPLIGMLIWELYLYKKNMRSI